VPPLANYLPGTIEDHASDGGIGRGNSDAATREFEGALHPDSILVRLAAHECEENFLSLIATQRISASRNTRMQVSSGPGFASECWQGADPANIIGPVGT
jgi:hypothetical protein